MTLTRNFPGRKQQRRISALRRLETQHSNIVTSLVSGAEETPDIRRKLNRQSDEIKVLESRISKGGRKTTKKVGKNIGRIS